MGREGQKLYRQAGLQNGELLFLSQDSVKMRQCLQDLENKAIASESDYLVGDYFCVYFLLAISKLLGKTCLRIRAWFGEGSGE